MYSGPWGKKLVTAVRADGGKMTLKDLEAMGYAYTEVEPSKAGFGGDGIWVAISRDPKTGELRAASNNRKNSAAVAY